MRIILLLLIPLVAFADQTKFEDPDFSDWDKKDVLDYKIEKFCYQHEEAQDRYWKQTHAERCSLILKAQIRFETNRCTKGSARYNNCFGFKSTGGFRKFSDKTKSIEYAVQRYYKYDKYKTIKQILMDSWYCSPVTGKCSRIKGFSRTVEHQPAYYNFVKDYFHENSPEFAIK